jgi:DNA-binding transcriptional LysR family regulator
LDIRVFEDFLHLVRSRSFSRSAAERRLTQPAFSRRIKALESWLGAALINRSTYPTTSTPAGEIFQRAAEDILRALYVARREIAALQEPDEDVVIVSVLHSLSATFVPEWLRRIGPDLGVTRLRFRSDNLDDGAAVLATGGSDFLLCFTHDNSPPPLDAGRFPSLLFGRDRILPVSVPAADGSPRFKLSGTADEPCSLLMYSPDSYLGRLIARLIRTRSAPTNFQTAYENSFVPALKAAALAGYGCAWLPLQSVASELDAGSLVPAGGGEWEIHVDIRLYRSGGAARKAVERVWASAARTTDAKTMQEPA